MTFDLVTFCFGAWGLVCLTFGVISLGSCRKHRREGE